MGVVADVQSYLAAQSLVDGGSGWPSVRRMEHDESEQLVVISEDGGAEPEIYAALGIGDGANEDPGVQVLVRGAAEDSDSSYAKAQAILTALHGLLGTTLGSNEYLRVRALTSDPVFLGFDDQLRPSHTIAFRLAASLTP